MTRDPSLAVLVLGKSDAEIEQFVVRSPHAHAEARLDLVSNPGKCLGGYATIANAFIEAATEDIVGVVHGDTTFGVGALSAFATAAADRIVGMVGRALDGTYVWSRHGGGFVSTLDSCSIFFPREIVLRFDGVNFDDFHCLVEDLCLQAKAVGIASFVPAAEAEHIGHIERPSDWMDNYVRYRARLGEKWRGVEFITT